MIPSATLNSAFEVGEKISSSVLADLYRARHLDTGKDALIKLIRTSKFSKPKTRARAFENRSDVLRARAPSLATVLELGRTDRDDVFLGVEWAEGSRLDEVVKLGQPRVLPYLLMASRALELQAAGGIPLLNLRHTETSNSVCLK